MKKIFLAACAAFIAFVALSGCASMNGGTEMTLSSMAIKNDVIAAKYGQFGNPADISEKNPATDDDGNTVIMKVNTLSFPLSVKNAPEGTKAYALYLHDPDAAVHGFGDFTHWTAVFTAPELKEGASIQDAASLIQGVNDWGDSGYAGMGPPDKLGYTQVTGGPTFKGTHEYHTYVIEVWALDSLPTLSNGFTLADLQTAIEGKTLAKAELRAKYFTVPESF